MADAPWRWARGWKACMAATLASLAVLAAAAPEQAAGDAGVGYGPNPNPRDIGDLSDVEAQAAATLDRVHRLHRRGMFRSAVGSLFGWRAKPHEVPFWRGGMASDDEGPRDASGDRYASSLPRGRGTKRRRVDESGGDGKDSDDGETRCYADYFGGDLESVDVSRLTDDELALYNRALVQMQSRRLRRACERRPVDGSPERRRRRLRLPSFGSRTSEKEAPDAKPTHLSDAAQHPENPQPERRPGGMYEPFDDPADGNDELDRHVPPRLPSSTNSSASNLSSWQPRETIPGHSTAIEHDSQFEQNYRQCPMLPKRVGRPRDIRDVRPDDIKAIMAMGDSVMTGFGTRVRALSDVFRGRASAWLEYRGTSFAMGNDSDLTTLANLFSHYNPKLIGASGGNHTWQVCWGLICSGVYTPAIDNLNAAQSGAMVMNLRWQLEYLVEQLETYQRSGAIDYHRDYKFMSVWAGSNDLCVGCSMWMQWLSFHPDLFETRMRKVIELIRTRVPNVIVNMMATLNISQVFEADRSRSECFIPRTFVLPVECPCGFLRGRLGARLRVAMDELGRRYNLRLARIAADYSRRQEDDIRQGYNFAAVFDPGMAGMSFLSTPRPADYLSALDCFHPSLKSHQLIAEAAWNNLFRRSDNKNQFYDPLDTTGTFCPTEHSRIQTL